MTYTAAKIAGFYWTENGQRATFQSHRGWGVRNDQGAFLSFNGIRPSVWDRRGIAQLIADTLTDAEDQTWITPA